MPDEAWWDDDPAAIVEIPADQMISIGEHPDYDPGGRGFDRVGQVHPAWGGRCQIDKLVTIHVTGGVRFTVHRGIAPLVKALAEATIRQGYSLRPAECGGYNCRRIRGSDSWSNHAWGLAVDLNWSSNPMLRVSWLIDHHGAGFPRSSWTDIPPEVVQLWTGAGFGWGGDYRNWRDAMHFEWLRSPQELSQRMNRMRLGALDIPDAPPPRLRREDDGEAVRRLQQMLAAAGFSPGAVDGHFGQATDAAVRSFQKARGLEADGIVGPRTWAALGAGGSTPAPPPPPPPPPAAETDLARSLPTLEQEASHAKVWTLQVLLETAGHDVGEADGVFGARTAAALRAFQQARGLTADAVCGPLTWTALLVPTARRLGHGDSGEEVRLAQHFLVHAGRETGGIDGIFGEGTTRATRDFQQAGGLAVDGVIGPATWGGLVQA